jgi:hypothetical protein
MRVSILSASMKRSYTRRILLWLNDDHFSAIHWLCSNKRYRNGWRIKRRNLVLLAIIGLIFQSDPAGAWKKITKQMSYFLDKSAVDVVQNIAQKASQPGKGFDLAVVILLFAIIFKFLPDAKIQWGDVWDRRSDDSNIFRERQMGARSLSGKRERCVRLRSGQLFYYAPTVGLLFVPDTALRR